MAAISCELESNDTDYALSGKSGASFESVPNKLRCHFVSEGFVQPLLGIRGTSVIAEETVLYGKNSPSLCEFHVTYRLLGKSVKLQIYPESDILHDIPRSMETRRNIAQCTGEYRDRWF